MELTSTAYEVGGLGTSPGTAASPDVTGAELHGGAFISPHGGAFVSPGADGGVGISPANAGAALAALRKMRAQPELVTTLRERSRMFLDLSRARGINTGFSEDTAVVPCIIGNSWECLRLSHALAERSINVQPILYPAVEEQLTRLRFFLTTRHSEAQIQTTVTALAEELEKIDPRLLNSHRS